MRKRLIVALLVTLALLLIAGCGKKQEQEPVPAPRGAQRGQQRPPEQRAQANMPDRQQFQMPDLIGEVASVSSGKITVKVVQLPQGGGGQPTPGGQRQTPGAAPGSLQERQLQYSGETKSLVIPEGVNVGVTARGQEPEGGREMPVTELKAGDVIQVWYTDKEQELVSRIILMRPAS